MFDPSYLKNSFLNRLKNRAPGANAGQTLNAPTSPFARFRSQLQKGPRPGLPSVIGNMFQGAATDQPPVAPEGAGMMPMMPSGMGDTANATPDANNPMGGGLAAIIARMRARQQAPQAPPMNPIAPTPPNQSTGNY
jgi:hypothetical protein